MAAQRGRRDPDAERVVVTLHSHSRALFWPSVVLIADVGAAGYFHGTFVADWANVLVVVGAILIAVLLWLLPLMLWLARRYTVTTKRLVVRRGLFLHTRHELLHSRGYNTTVRKNALQTLFRSGDVLVNTGLDSPVVLHDVPLANLVQRSLQELTERALNPIASRLWERESEPHDGVADSQLR